MKVLVVCVDEVATVPPVISLSSALLFLGHDVSLIGYGLKRLPLSIRSHEMFTSIDLGDRNSDKNALARVVEDIKNSAVIKRYLNNNIELYDYVWTTSDLAARDCGKILLKTTHIMQLLELSIRVPLFTRHDIPVSNKVVPLLAENAHRVVVPEYNRSFIQQAWWGLSKRPAVLPNKPYLSDEPYLSKEYEDIDSIFRKESRKIVLYQGVFTEDRDFTPIAEAIRKLDNNDYALYLMGVRSPSDREYVDRLKEHYGDLVVPIPFVPAPLHLYFARYGYIGLLPYVPARNGRQSPLNGLYCAPNKIWEYSYYGLPMLGSEVPGLTTVFSQYGIGETAALDNVSDIQESLIRLSEKHDQYSQNSKLYYKTVDYIQLVNNILQ